MAEVVYYYLLQKETKDGMKWEKGDAENVRKENARLENAHKTAGIENAKLESAAQKYTSESKHCFLTYKRNASFVRRTESLKTSIQEH